MHDIILNQNTRLSVYHSFLEDQEIPIIFLASAKGMFPEYLCFLENTTPEWTWLIIPYRYHAVLDMVTQACDIQTVMKSSDITYIVTRTGKKTYKTVSMQTLSVPDYWYVKKGMMLQKSEKQIKYVRSLNTQVLLRKTDVEKAMRDLFCSEKLLDNLLRKLDEIKPAN